jgi:hypothetical protein
MPISLAVLAASNIALDVLTLIVPIFTTSAFASLVISATSLSSSAMIGDAPANKQILAQSCTVT